MRTSLRHQPAPTTDGGYRADTFKRLFDGVEVTWIVDAENGRDLADEL
jgi:hypothetical protein